MRSSTITKETATDNWAKIQNGFLTTTQLAKLCGVSRYTIINWIKRGEIRAIKTLGGQYRIAKYEAVFFLETLKV